MSTELVKNEAGLPKFKPVADIVEKEDGFHILMDLPGVSKESLAIDLDEKEVTVSGKTEYAADPTVDANERYIHVEFGGAEYVRTFRLSDVVDRERIEARLDQGVLDLYLPKSEMALPKRIEISS